MLSITRKIVNDRISNRADNIVSGLGLGLIQCLRGMRCFLHQVCCVLGRGIDHLAAKPAGLKRYAYEPASASSRPSWSWTTTRTKRNVRLAGFTQLAG